jgi:hypothetical protein
MEIRVRNSSYKWTLERKHTTCTSLESRSGKGTLHAIVHRLLNCILAVYYAYGGVCMKMY